LEYVSVTQMTPQKKAIAKTHKKYKDNEALNSLLGLESFEFTGI